MKFLQKHKIEFWIFMILWLTYAYFYQASQHNENARFDQVRAIVEKGQLNIDPFCGNTADLIRYPGDNKLYPNKAPGTVFVGVPFFIIFKAMFSIFSFPEWIKWHFICYLTTIFTLNLLGAICGLCVYWFLLRLSKNIPLSIFVTFAYALGTIAFPFATVYFSHQLAASLVFISFYAVFAVVKDFDIKGKTTRYDYLRMILGGLCGGFAFATEYPTGIAIFFIQGYAFFELLIKRKCWRRWSIQCLFFVLGIAPLFWYNLAAFNKIWYVPYSAYTEKGATSFQEHKKGFVGVQLPWDNPRFFEHMKEITYKPFRGLFYCNPVLWLIFPGFIIGFILMFLKKKFIPETLMCFFIFISFMIFNANYGDSALFWGGGYSIGPRHIVPMLPFLVLPLLFFANIQGFRQIFYVAALISIFFSLAAAAVEVRAPFEYNNPVFQLHIPFFLRGKLAICNTGVFSCNFLTENSVAFNIGKILRLEPVYQMLPLYIFWLFGILYLFKAVKEKVLCINTDIAAKRKALADELDGIKAIEAKTANLENALAESHIPSADFVPFAMESSDSQEQQKSQTKPEMDEIQKISIDLPKMTASEHESSENPGYEPDYIEITKDPELSDSIAKSQISIPENENCKTTETDIAADNAENKDSESKDIAPAVEVIKSPREIEIENELKNLTPHPKFYFLLTFIIISLYIFGLAAAPPVYVFYKNLKFQKGTGLVGKYYATADFTGEVKILQKDPIIDFDWSVGPPLPGSFSVSWEGNIKIEKDGQYTFFTESDDASWLWIDERMIVTNPGEHARRVMQGSISLNKGTHKIKVHFANYRFGAYMKILWAPPGEHQQSVPPDVLDSPPTTPIKTMY